MKSVVKKFIFIIASGWNPNDMPVWVTQTSAVYDTQYAYMVFK